jgi:hypothetical protein
MVSGGAILPAMFAYVFGMWSWVLMAVAIVHFIRRRPDTYWIFVIIFFGGLGSLIYILVEVLPDLGQFRFGFNWFERRRRIGQMEETVRQNPSAGNYEELGDLYLDNGKFASAKECLDKAIGTRTDSIDAFYRRGICELRLGQFQQAREDLERVVRKEPKYDLMRAPGLLARAYAKCGDMETAAALFADTLERSTVSETMYHYAEFLRDQGRTAEAREWAQKVLAKKPGMPGYLKRRERGWFRRASALLRNTR